MSRWCGLMLMTLAACGGPAVETAPATTDPTDPTEPTDSEPTDSEPAADPDLCDTDGLTRRPLQTEGAFGDERRDLADDFTLSTPDGDFEFFEQWTGCETYVVLSDLMPTSPLDDTPMIDQVDQLAELIEKSPRNVHYFFVSYRSDSDDFVAEVQANLDDALAMVDDDLAEHLGPRLHVVDEPASNFDNWVQEALFHPGYGFAIDRFQRIRDLGSLGDVMQYDVALGNIGYWPWRDSVAYAAHMPAYFNYESDLDDRASDPAFTTLYLMYDEPVWLTGKDRDDVVFPDAATMAGYDTMLIDLQHHCDPALDEWGNCDAWDAVQSLWLCDEDDVCTVEVARYITTYHREGRWLADASQLLPYFREGGAHRLALLGIRGGHYVTLRVLLGTKQSDGLTPYAIVPMWTGGGFDANYDANHPPMTVDVPSDMVKATLQVTVTGHGMSEGDNCAEFCDHRHYFAIGGSTWAAEHPTIDNIVGCLEQIPRGAVPNQYGTWWYNRSSWCPGMQVEPWVFDVTSELVAGSPATVSYTTNYGDVEGGTIELRTFMVFWK